MSTSITVILLRNGEPAGRAADVAVTEIDGVLDVNSSGSEGGSERGSALQKPGASIDVMQLALPDAQGTATVMFTIEVVDNGIVLRPRLPLAQRMVESRRDEVIALALAEVRRKTGLPLDRIKSVFIEQL